MENVCQMCHARFTTPYDFKQKFCSPECKTEYIAELQEELEITKGERVECPHCHWKWKPRGEEVNYCPRCRKRPTLSKEVPDDDIKIACQYCGKLRPITRVMCKGCMKASPESRYRYGLTHPNWEKFLKFLRDYEGEEAIVSRLRDLLIEDKSPSVRTSWTDTPETVSEPETPVEVELTPEQAIAALEEAEDLPAGGESVPEDNVAP